MRNAAIKNVENGIAGGDKKSGEWANKVISNDIISQSNTIALE